VELGKDDRRPIGEVLRDAQGLYVALLVGVGGGGNLLVGLDDRDVGHARGMRGKHQVEVGQREEIAVVVGSFSSNDENLALIEPGFELARFERMDEPGESRGRRKPLSTHGAQGAGSRYE
jgi:hypothetical protein